MGKLTTPFPKMKNLVVYKIGTASPKSQKTRETSRLKTKLPPNKNASFRQLDKFEYHKENSGWVNVPSMSINFETRQTNRPSVYLNSIST